MDLPQDVPLRRVTEYVTEFLDCFENRCPGQQLPPLLEEVSRLHWRSREMLVEFSGYFCLRLVLDEDSPLATQFVDFFSELNWLMASFEEEVKGVPLAANATVEKVIELGRALLECLQPVVSTCLLHFCIYQSFLFPFTDDSNPFIYESKDFKRIAKSERLFCQDAFHCVTRSLGFVNLDTCGKNWVELHDSKHIGKGSYGEVYKGYFTTGNGDSVGDPVAVKMFRGSGMSESSDPYSGAGSSGAPCMAETKMSNSRNTSDSEQFLFNVQSFLTILTGRRDWIKSALSDELKMLASLRHPNVVNVKGYITRREGKSNRIVIGECGIVMELMDKSLYDSLDDDMELKELEMIDLMLEIAKGMRFLHECNVTHRDLKPGNVLLRRRKPADEGAKLGCVEVKLADLGLAKRLIGKASSSDSMHTTFAGGTPFYLAPELYFKEETKYKDTADVFSYGTTCFNIVTGNPSVLSYTGVGVKEFYKKFIRGVWKKWVEGRPGHLVDVIERCWQTEPSKRPTFAEICLALQYKKRCVLASKCVRPLPKIMEIANPLPMLRSALRNEDQGLSSGKRRILWLAEAVKTSVRALRTHSLRMDVCREGRCREIFDSVEVRFRDLLRFENDRPRIAGVLAEAVQQLVEGNTFSRWRMSMDLNMFLERAVHRRRETNFGQTAGMDQRPAEGGASTCEVELTIPRTCAEIQILRPAEGGASTFEVEATLLSWSRAWSRLLEQQRETEERKQQQETEEGKQPFSWGQHLKAKLKQLFSWGGQHLKCFAIMVRGDGLDLDSAAAANRRVNVLLQLGFNQRVRELLQPELGPTLLPLWDIHDINLALFQRCVLPRDSQQNYFDPRRDLSQASVDHKDYHRGFQYLDSKTFPLDEIFVALFALLYACIEHYEYESKGVLFNFGKDDAQTPLHVDESIIPLLLSFHMA